MGTMIMCHFGLWVSGAKFLTDSIMKITFFGKPVQNSKISSTWNKYNIE